jgi:hypothetical protein
MHPHPIPGLLLILYVERMVADVEKYRGNEHNVRIPSVHDSALPFNSICRLLLVYR